MCPVCGGTPCDWIVYGEDVITQVELMYDEDPNKGDGTVQNNCIRKSAYRYFTYEKHGFLGKGNRIQISKCVLDGIREK